MKYLTNSANQNNSFAQCLLGLLYILDMHIPHDYNKSIYYLALSANGNISMAQYLLGMFYHVEDVNKGEKYINSLSKNNDIFSTLFFELLYKNKGMIY